MQNLQLWIKACARRKSHQLREKRRNEHCRFETRRHENDRQERDVHEQFCSAQVEVFFVLQEIANLKSGRQKCGKRSDGERNQSADAKIEGLRLVASVEKIADDKLGDVVQKEVKKEERRLGRVQLFQLLDSPLEKQNV